MKLAAIALAVAALSPPAHAESFFQAEVGLGVSSSRDLGDGVWYQQGLPHHEQTVAPAFLVGLTGTVYRHGAFDLGYHLDYTFIGEQRASCMCVPDANYDQHTHQVIGQAPRLSPFNGHGHLQGISLTLEGGYTWANGIRLSAEAGPWVYWNTWHETVFDLANRWDNLNHKTTTQLGWVAGVGVSKGPWAVRYRYYSTTAKWNPYPALTRGTHMLFVTYTF